VYQVAPHGCVSLNGSNSESTIVEEPTQDIYQEDGLDGTFIFDLGDALDSMAISLDSDEVTDPMDLETIEKRIVDDDEYDEDAILDEDGSTDEEEEAMDEEDEDIYDPNDF